jgi:hypothetical protein
VELISCVDAAAANGKPYASSWSAVASYRKLHETICEFY